VSSGSRITARDTLLDEEFMAGKFCYWGFLEQLRRWEGRRSAIFGNLLGLSNRL